MKLTDKTIEILKNFVNLNQSIQFKIGNVIKTITPTKTVFSIAEIEESFPNDFAIYDLNKFLAKVSLYKDCELEFEEDRVIFRTPDKRKFDYIKYSSPKVISAPPDGEIRLDNPEHEFKLSREDLLWQKKSAGISGSPFMIFRGDGKHIYLENTDLKDDSSDLSSTTIGSSKEEFLYAIKVENWKMMDGSYNIKLAKGMAKFENTETTKKLEYYIAIESSLSKF